MPVADWKMVLDTVLKARTLAVISSSVGEPVMTGKETEAKRMREFIPDTPEAKLSTAFTMEPLTGLLVEKDMAPFQSGPMDIVGVPKIAEL